MSRLSNWTARHGHALLSTSGYLARHGMATLLTVLVLGLALALPLSLQVLVRNVRAATGDFSDAIGLSVYLKPGVGDAKAQQLAQNLRARPGVAAVTLVTAEQALAQMRAQPGFDAALDALTDNPFPGVLDITPAPSASSLAALDALRSYVIAWPEVDSVQLDRAWVARYTALLGALRRLVAISAALLGAGVIAAVGNTIRLEIRARRAEIEITKLVGGSNAFVRRPFLYAGGLYGVAGGLIAWATVAAARLALAPAVARVASAYGSRFTLQGPTPRELAALLAVGAALGWLGAGIAAARELARIEPRAD